ncbi:MAG: threonine--tRNA ligase [Clostridiales bacterium]|jgi:threonyl-tRNA synthetase|nr:threonine--tRNA ligase [Clostridiales bacterium]
MELEVLRHSASHLLAHAVKRLYPDAKLGIGPATNTGFYYDFDFSEPVTMADLEKIEQEMAKISKENLKIERFELSKQEAIALMQEQGQIYKIELINELPEGEAISFYRQGDFVDLCRGPHVNYTAKIKHFKLLSVTGAYWRGSEKNKMLTRIYGAAFATKDELLAHLQALEEAKKRDHNKLGRELGIFMTEENIGQGLPLLMPKGAKIMQKLIRWVEDEEEKRGYLFTRTPFMAKSNLYKISGHWDHYREGMFILGEEGVDDGLKALRPMTCPFQFMIYKNGIKSYRDLPLRYAETSALFRNESSGEMHGLIRVRQFTLSDGHIICAPEQVKDEFKNALELSYYLMDTLGLREDITFRFSKWDPNNSEKYINDPQKWETTQKLMKEILDDLGIDYVEAEGEAAFYGPKLDFQIKNVYGKEDTIITIQIDFALAERFGMEYTDADGQKKHPIILHRSSIGCYERTLALLIEKYAGAFPIWLAPVQVVVMSLTDRAIDEAEKVYNELKNHGILAQKDTRAEKIGYKIREAQINKIPYMLIIGDKEKEQGVVSVRSRKDGDLGAFKLNDFIKKIKHEIDTKAR